MVVVVVVVGASVVVVVVVVVVGASVVVEVVVVVVGASVVVVVVVVVVKEVQAAKQEFPAGTTSCVGVPKLVFIIL